MRVRAVLAALVVMPFLAAAQTSPPTEAPREPDWTFGGGVSFGVGAVTSSLSVGGLTVTTQIPTVAASLERRLAGRTWLVLGGAGGVAHRRADVQEGSYGYPRDDSRQGFLTAGVRHALTSAGAPVEVSAIAYVEGGLVDADQRLFVFTTESREDVTMWVAGVGAGIAIDRELTHHVSLRVASPLLQARYARLRVKETGQPAQTATDLSAGALVVPRLELRVAF